MKITDFDVYKDILKEKSGLIITEDKSYLLESRLNPIVKKWGFTSLADMAMALSGVPDRRLVDEIVEAMTTNETSFFRDMHPFDRFRDDVLPYVVKSRVNERRFKLWCAAASSGQEPYSLAMLIKEAGAQFAGWNMEIVGTDISHDILAQAKEGLYSQFEVQRGLPIQLLMKYFKQEGEKWRVSDDLKKMITYKHFNLLDNMSAFGQLDVIFCRNVLIYFDEGDKRIILEKMEKQLKNDGFLFLGGAETVLGITDVFRPIPGMRGVYAKEGSPHLEATPPAASQTLAS